MNGRKPGTILLLLSVLSAMASSGCINQGTASGTGVVMENFEPDFAKIYAGETFKLQAKVRNAGSVDAIDVGPKLYNIGGKSSNGQSFEIECSSECDSKCVNLLAPDPERGTIGESLTCIWNCHAPENIPKGMSVTFNPSVRLYYVYGTDTVKSVTIASQDELRAIQNQGKALPSETVSTTSGPVQLDVVVKGPIRYWPNEGKIVFPININIQNAGGGTACGLFDITNSASAAQGTSRCSAGIGQASGSNTPLATSCGTTSNWDSVGITFDDTDKTISLSGCGIPGKSGGGGLKVDLWKGQSSTITCEVGINVGDVPKTGFVQKNLKFSIDYDYFVDASTSIEVVGRDITQG